MKSKRAREAAVAAEEDKDALGTAAGEPPAKKRKSDGDVKAAKKAKKDEKDKKDKRDKKDKKDKRDKKVSRKERNEKKKDLQDLPEEDETEPMAVDEPASPPAPETNGDKEKKKKAKKAMNNGDYAAAQAEEHVTAAEVVTPKKTKKDDKDNKDKVDAVSAEQQQDAAQGGDVNGEKKTKDKKEKKDKAEKKATKEKKDRTNGAGDTTKTPEEADKPDRHIVFVGNLPYSATTALVTAHFASLNPASVRCLTKRDCGACRGMAFVEFVDVRAQRTCLDRFHHSLFDDGKSPARKINVELTAGGGGKTKHRTDKIRAKNEKLDENRAKHIEREKASKDDAGAKAKKQPDDQQQGMGDSIHPSRLARNPGLGH